MAPCGSPFDANAQVRTVRRSAVNKSYAQLVQSWARPIVMASYALLRQVSGNSCITFPTRLHFWTTV